MNRTSSKLFSKAKPWLRPLVRATSGKLPRRATARSLRRENKNIELATAKRL
jgi:hypothetical protein